MTNPNQINTSSNDDDQADELAELANVDPAALAATVAWLVDGQQLEHVREALAAHFPDTDPNQALAAAGQRFIEDAGTDADALRGWALNAYREIYRRSLELGDHATALRAAKLLAES